MDAPRNSVKMIYLYDWRRRNNFTHTKEIRGTNMIFLEIRSPAPCLAMSCILSVVADFKYFVQSRGPDFHISFCLPGKPLLPYQGFLYVERYSSSLDCPLVAISLPKSACVPPAQNLMPESIQRSKFRPGLEPLTIEPQPANCIIANHEEMILQVEVILS